MPALKIKKPRLRKAAIIAAASCFALVLGIAVYWIGLHWLQGEFARAAVDLTRQQAEAAANELAMTLPASSVQNSVEFSLTLEAKQSLQRLVRERSNILLVLISDSKGRAIYPVFGHNRIGQQYQAELGGEKMPRGIDIQTLAKAIRRTMPSGTVEVSKSLGRERRPRGGLLVFVDPSIQEELVDRATMHIGHDLIPVLVVMLAFCGAIMGLLARQRRVTDRLRQQRDQAESLAHVGTLAAGLAHEIRNPVNALAMQLDMLEEDFEVGSREQLEKRAERIRSGLSNLERTVHEFLNYAMPERQKPAALDLAAELTGLAWHAGESVHAAEKSAAGQPPHEREPVFQLKISEDLKAWCDPHAFRQIVSVLLANALRSQRKQSSARLLIEAYREGARVVVAVEDGGPGIPPENRDQIFEAFFTTEPDGTGLGLPIARRLAQMNHGELVLSERHASLGGARFELRLQPEKTG